MTAVRIETKYRRIVEAFPTPDSEPIFETMRHCEPRSVDTQVHILWNSAEGSLIADANGNQWIDFTSGIIVANAGHGHPRIRQALREQLDKPLLHAYLFATQARADLVRKLIKITPSNLEKAFLLSTGSEAIECAIKISRLWGMKQSPQKRVIISFDNSFHVRTMGSQLLCSADEPKAWITPDPDICQIPFPRCSECPWGRDRYDHCGRECLKKGFGRLRDEGIDLERITSFVVEGYQGIRGPIFWPDDYLQALQAWCREHGSLIIVDEIQSGFGRTGKLFAYQHHGIEPDLVCCGKGISSSLPLSTVLGRAEIMDTPDPGAMTSTHTGNPLCCAATLASIEVLQEENLIDEAARKGAIVAEHLDAITKAHSERIAMITGRGLVFGVFFVDPATGKPDIDMANTVTEQAIGKGLMLFVTHNGTIKLAPPLSIPDDVLTEGLDVIAETIEEACRGK